MLSEKRENLMLFHCPAPGTAAERVCHDADGVLASTLYPDSFGSGGRVGAENVTQKPMPFPNGLELSALATL